MIYTHSKRYTSNYRIRIGIHKGWLLKIVNWKTRTTFSTGPFQDSVHPQTTKGGLAATSFHQKVCCCIKQKKMQFPSGLNCEIKAVARGDSDNTTAGVQVFEIMSSWLNDCKEQILFLVTIHFKKGFSENTVCEHWWKLPTPETAHQTFTSTGKCDL